MERQEGWTIRSRRVLLPGGKAPEPAAIVIRGERIAEVRGYEEAPTRLETLDAGDSVVMPGLVDTHAHINEPGRTEWEGFETATRAAAAGGITTVIDMPLNSIPATTTCAALETKARAAEGKCTIDYGFWGGVIPGNARELEPMIRAGAWGFKAFLIESGVDEFPCVGERELREAMPILARAGVPLLVHAELDHGHAPHASGVARSYRTYLDSRPAAWEVDAIRLMIRLSRETGCRVHIVHLSAAEALVDLHEARAAGVPITAETCPHYLGLAAEEIPDGATQFKCAPPIRGRENRDRLWSGLVDADIEFVVSDHSPCTPELKRMESGDFEKAWGGIAGLQFSMPVVWTEMRRRGLPLERLSQWMSERTSKFIGLTGRKGAIAAGCDADLVIWDPERAYKLDRSMIRHRHSVTPYEGRELFGVVEKTFVRGSCVYDSGSFPGRPAGHALRRGGRET